MRHVLLYLSLCILTLVLAGCSDDPVTPPVDAAPSSDVAGEFSELVGDIDIEFRDLLHDGRLSPGPFLLRGRHVHYDDSLGALVADLTITSLARTAFPEPITLTFVRLLPPGVTVLNPDNDEHGPGAQIVFEFENDDAMWTPGETSIPRTVQFGVEKGHSIGFVARLGVGPNPEDGGAIGGTVWADLNEDGIRDRNEMGIGGVRILLKEQNGDPLLMRPVQLWETRTNHDGMYRFHGLRPGHYIVVKPEQPGIKPTTPTRIDVFLVEDDSSGVSDFMYADFGCLPMDGPPPPPDDGLMTGDWVDVSGKYDEDHNILFARDLDHTPCRTPNPCDSTSTTNDCPCARTGGVLRGPVTAFDSDRGIIEVMGVPFSFAFEQGILIEVGTPVEVHVQPFFVGYGVVKFDFWEGDHQEIHGRIWRIIDANATGTQRAINVLGLLVALSNLTNG